MNRAGNEPDAAEVATRSENTGPAGEGLPAAGPAAQPRPALTGWRRVGTVLLDRATLGAVAVVAVAAPLRAAAIGFGLPILTHPDEPVNVRVGEAMSVHSDWNPHRFNYPSMLYDTIAVFVRAHRWLTGQRGAADSGVQIQNLGVAVTSEPGLFIALRTFTMLLSIAMCLLAYAVVLRVTGRVLAALLAGLLLAVSPVAVTNGVFISPDTYSGLFSALALLGAIGVAGRGRRLDYLLAGAGVGLAAAAKYNAAVVAVALVGAHLIRHRASSWRHPKILLSGVAAVVLFVLVTPAAVLDPHHFLAGALAEAQHYAHGHDGSTGGSLWFNVQALRRDPVLLGGSALSILCLRSPRRREIAVILAFTLAYGGLLSVQEVHFARNLLPILPALAMLAGFAAAVGADRLSRQPAAARRVLTAGAGAVLAAGVAGSAVAAAGIPRQLAERPRTETLDWLTAHVPAGSRVVVESYGPYLPQDRYRLTSTHFLATQTRPPPDTSAVVVVTELGSGRFLSQPQHYPSQVANYHQMRTRYCLAGRWTDGPWVEVLTPCPADGTR